MWFLTVKGKNKNIFRVIVTSGWKGFSRTTDDENGSIDKLLIQLNTKSKNISLIFFIELSLKNP